MKPRRLHARPAVADLPPVGPPRRRGRGTAVLVGVLAGLAGGLSAEVVINELHVDPNPKTSFVEFIELHNTGTGPVDVAGWQFTNGVQFTFPAGASLPAGGYLVVAGNPAAVAAGFGITGVLGPWTGKLSNEGETVTLRDASGAKADEVSYKIGFPWPTVGDAPGYSMELLNPAFDNDLGGHWRSSAGVSVNPGTLLAAGAAGWTYVKGTAEPASDWRAEGFDDSGWTAATLPIGYGESGIATSLSDMQNRYTTVYLRRTFEVPDAGQVSQLQARMRYDDGFNMWINGVHVLSNNVSGPELACTATAVENRENNDTITFALPDPAGYLQTGTNTIAVQLLNQRLDSGDCYLNLALVTNEGAAAGPTPGALNSVFTAQAPTAMRQVSHTPLQPASGQPVTVTVKATDPDGLAAVTLEYQVVEPGSYIRLTDAAYSNSSSWTAVPMADDGTGADALAGDATWTAEVPGAVQAHRRLVRYRIRATDAGGRTAPAPCADDPVPNFAWFAYDGVPDWQGALQPGVTPVLTFPAATLAGIPVYHLIADNSDVINCQYNGAYNDDVYRWYGTLVYNGAVYDHVGYRIRGSASVYNTGKNKWKFRFRTGHDFEALDADGNPYPYKWENLTLSALMCPWWANDASTGGTILNETAAMDLYRLAGVPSIRSHFFHYRIIDDAVEASASSQYEGDFWGLYIAIEETEADYLEANGLPDGNVYNCNGSVAASVKRNQGPTAVQDFSDFSAEMSYATGHHLPSPYQPYSYWTANIALDNYYRFNAANHLVNNTDMYINGNAIERNMVYYRNPDTGLWWTLPWDLDLTFESAPHWYHPDTDWEHFWYVMSAHGVANIAYQNVVREVSDLLVRNGDAVKVIEAAAARLCPFQNGMPVSANGWPQANQAMWDHHPRAAKKGIFYKNMGAVTDFTGYYNYLRNYVTTGGYGGAAVEAKLTLAGVPNTPVVTYAGAGGYPANDLRFEVGAFSDTDGGSFAALQWRIAEVTPTGAPGYPAVAGGIRYEINATWTHETTTYAPTIRVPPAGVRAGGVYRVRARMRDNTGHWSRWSAPVEFTATAADAALWQQNLVVSEINYHPLPPATPAELAATADKNDFEFIELRNISASETLDLADLAFTAGITFDFAGAAVTELAPGACVLVVKNPAAFEARYGTGLPVAGTYPNSLDNAGEQLVLALAGTTVRDFTYDDDAPWPTSPDGSGPTLVLTDPFANPDHGVAANWRASHAAGGTPGTAEPTLEEWRLAHFGTTADAGPAANTADPDGDGLANLMEYALGLDPGAPEPLSARLATDTATGHLRLSVTRNPDATDLTWAVEVSGDLAAWAGVEGTDVATETDLPGLLVVSDLTPAGDAPRRFIRLRVTLPAGG